MANIKQPRASIACSRNRDPDYLLLASEGIDGLAAVALFDALLCAAKDQDNEGRFDLPEKVIAAMVGVEIKTYSNLIQRLIKTGWLIIDGQGVAVRSFAKWNPKDDRGGAREGAGRPSKIGNQNNQSEIKPISNDIQNSLSPSPSQVPKDKSTSASDKPKRRSWSGDWEPTLAKLLLDPGTAGARCKMLNTAAGIAGKPACEALLRDLEGKQWTAKDIGHAYAYLTSCLKAKVTPSAQNKVSVQYQRGDEAYGD